jgi:PAS domain S-box-containing protein
MASRGCARQAINVSRFATALVKRRLRVSATLPGPLVAMVGAMTSSSGSRATDEEYRTLVESIRDYAIFHLDADGRIRSWNAGARLLKGYEEGEVVGRTISLFYPQEERDARLPERLLDQARRYGRVEDVGWRVRKDGTRFWASVVITALKDESGNITGFGKVTRDLTDSSYKKFVEATHSILWTTDGGGVPTIDSQSWRDFTGQSVDDWISLRAWDAVHEEDRARVADTWRRAQEEKRIFEIEFRLRRKDGQFRWMSSRALPLLDNSGEVREWFGVTVDIQARKQAEHEAARAAQWWTTTLTSIGDAVVATDRDGCVRFLNPIAEKLMGLKTDEARGQPLASVFHIVNEETREPVTNPVEKVFETGAIVGLANHTVLIAKDGAETPIDDSAAPIRNEEGELDGVVLVFRDVSAEKRARARREYLARMGEELLRAKNYRQALATLARLAVPQLADWCAVEIKEAGREASEQIAVAHVDPTKVELARQIQERYPPDQTAATGVPEVLRTGKAEMYPVVPQQLLEQSARDEEHLRLIRELRLHSAMVVPLSTGTGVIGAITFAYAESDREYGEEDLAFAEDLAKRAALVIARHKAEADALAADRAKDEFLATVSHELRTPLQAMLGWATMLMRNSARDPQKALEAILRSAQTQARLIDDILDVARIVSGKLELTLTDVSVAGVIHAAVDAVRPAAQARKVEISVDIDADAGVLEADADRVQQVVWNLLSNAVKFSDVGGRVTIRAQRNEGVARIEVSDTGRGIAKENLRAIFERFLQVNGGNTRDRGGLGLGLAIVRYLVEAHGGHVEARSDGLGKGATFAVTLPLHRTTAPALSRPPPTGTAHGGVLADKLVLVVDDDEDSRELVAQALESAGAAVERAASAAEGLRALMRARPHVLVSDIAMPVEDGYSFLAKVRALPSSQGGDVAALALTAFARAEDIRRAQEAGFDAHVAKPVDPGKLIETVKSARRRTR